MTDLKPEDLARLREIAEKATPGPWENGGSSVTNWHDHTFEMEWIPNGQDYEGEADGVNSNAEADGAFIAAFNPQVCLSLLADRARMEKALRNLTRAFDSLQVERWDDETKVEIHLPRTKRVRPVSWVYVSDVKEARQALGASQ